MNNIWALILILSNTDAVQPHKCNSKPKVSTNPAKVYQPNKELTVNSGDSAVLHCCVIGEKNREIVWYKQPAGEKPRIMAKWYKGESTGDTFYNEFKKSRFHIETNSHCNNMTIFNTSKSDEAMYYCGLTAPELVFADGTYLSIKVPYESTLLNNSTDMLTQGNMDLAVIGLGTAMTLCVVLILCLICFTSKTECQNCRLNATENKLNEPGILHFTSLNFSKRRENTERTANSLSEDYVYTVVNYTG